MSSDLPESFREQVRPDVVPTIDLLTTTEAGQVLGVTGQTIKNWVRAGRFPAVRVGGRIMIAPETLATYIARAGESLELDDLLDDEAATLVAEDRQGGK